MEGPRAPRVLITGGASGIGRAAAILLARRGSRIMALDVADAEGETLAPEAGVPRERLIYRHADVSVEAEVQAAVADAQERWGTVDALIAAAGIMRGQATPLPDLDEATWDLVVDVNLKGTFLAAKHAGGAMIPAGRGVIVLVGSKAGVSVGSGSYAYGASKGGIHGLAMTLDRHLGPQGIRVNEVCPGDVDTPLFRRSIAEAVQNGADPAWAEGVLAKLTPPGQIAELLAWLVSDAAACVRGTIFTS
jgi:NAD(P)-dependent dehydrogenase (short-subunit alcohol dehydrogenase family)